MGCGTANFGRRGLKPPKLENLVSKFVPRGFEAQQEGFRGKAAGRWQGILLSFEVPSDYQEPRGTAGNYKALRCSISAALP